MRFTGFPQNRHGIGQNLFTAGSDGPAARRCLKLPPPRPMNMNPLHPSATPQLPRASWLFHNLGLAAGLLLAGWLVPASATPPGNACAPGRNRLETMTVNLYIGGSTTRVVALDPTDPNYFTNLVWAVTGLYYEIAGSQPALRLQAVADQIASRQPDIVAVQEATLLRIQSSGDLAVGGTTPATEVVFDYVQMLVDALEARGAHYTVAATSEEWDIEMPMLNLQTYGLDDIRQTDREAILVRSDLPPGHLRVSNPQSGHFANVIQLPAIGFSVTRGWCAVDVFSRGDTFRYVCTHLEEETAPQIQVAQVQELLAGPAQTRLPVVLVGDFNADPLHRDRPAADPSAYPLVLQAGFLDSWAAVHPLDPTGGLTWGHDEFLADPATVFDRRIDFVFVRGTSLLPLQADSIDLTLDRAGPPLWASDHATLAVELLLGPGHN
jgi:endonuclease/exonuclease/phosphatase family metal-dependent hydrolase